MARIALINYHSGSIAINEALFEVLGHKVTSITYLQIRLRHPYSHPELRHKIMRKVNRAFITLRKILRLFKPSLTTGGLYPPPLAVYRLLLLVGLLKDEDYIAVVMFKTFRFLSKNLPQQQLEHFSQSCSSDPVFRRFFRDIDFIATSFPPRLTHIARIFSDRFNLRLIILSGHRFNLNVHSPDENEMLKKNLLEARQNSRHILASASLYDLMYTQHYLNVKPEPLFNFSFYITQKVEQPDNNIVLLGPVNARNHPVITTYKKNITHAYELFCDRNSLTPKFTFRFIRNVYPIRYELNQLARHPAVVILPYSVFSVSQEELYDLNIPYFVPSVDFLIQSGMMNDRVLYDPGYISLDSYKSMESDFEDDGSPNCKSEAAQRKWLPYSSCYQKENAIIFDNLTDLAQKIHTIDQDGDRLRQKMYLENVKRRDESLKLWSKVLEATHGVANE